MDIGNGCGVNVPCSVMFVGPICVYLCVQFPCGEALGDGDGFEGSVVVRLVPVGCFSEWLLGS